MREMIYLVKGEVTSPDLHHGSKLGDVEWQFSDGPPGQRGSSSDYVDLDKGLADHADCVVLHEDGEGGWAHGGDPRCAHNWVEWVGEEGNLLEPALDVCNSCGAVRK